VWTQWSDLHPVLVHVPISLLPIAVVFDLLGWGMRRPKWEKIARAFYVLGAIGAWLALWAGDRAAESMVDLDGTARAAIMQHGDLAHFATWSFTLVAVGGLLWSRLGFDPGEERSHPVRLLLLALALVGTVLLAGAAVRGTRAVYRHGVGVDERAVSPRASDREPSPPAARTPLP